MGATPEDFDNAGLDLQTISDVTNGAVDAPDVNPRLGGDPIHTLRKQLKIILDAGGFLTFDTKAAMDAYTPEVSGLAFVAADSDPELIGVYRWDDTDWVAAPEFYNTLLAIMQPQVDIITNTGIQVAADASQVATDRATVEQVVPEINDAKIDALNDIEEAKSGQELELENHEYRIQALESGVNVPMGGILEAEIMADTGATLTQVGPNGLPTNGYILRIRFKGIGASATVDPTKATLTVIRPGFQSDREWSASNILETLTITGLYRTAYPGTRANQFVTIAGTDLDTYWAISEPVFYLDRCYMLNVQAGFYGSAISATKTVVDNNSTKAYEHPVVDAIGLPFISRMPSTGLYFEWAVQHHAGRNGQMVAAIDSYIIDNVASPGSAHRNSVTVTTETPSAVITGPYTVPVYAGTIPITGLSDSNNGGMSLKVYPWVSGPTPWDLADWGVSRVDNIALAAYQPVFIDSDNSYAYGRAYVSHTGALIGSPAISTAALAAYSPGVTAAYATAKDVFLAGRTFNNNGANRARPHNDINAIEAVLPNGTIISGFGADIANQTNYPVATNGAPLPRVTSETGASLSTTGIGVGTNKTYRHLSLENIGIFPGAAGAATHTVLDGSNAGAASSAPATLSAAVLLRLKNVRNHGNSDNSNPTLYRAGYRMFLNCDFQDCTLSTMLANQTLYQGVVVHGGTFDFRNSSPNPTGMTGSTRIAGARFYQLCCQAELATRTVQAEIGQSVINSRFDVNSPTGGGSNCSIGSNKTAVGVRGFAIVGCIIRSTCPAGSPAERPALQIHADYSNPNDQPAVATGIVYGNTGIGGRYNRIYLEAGNSAFQKFMYEKDNIWEDENTKGDFMDADGVGPLTPSAYRTGNWPFRMGTGRRGNRNGKAASNTANVSVFGETSWLGEVPAPGCVASIGSANIVVSNTGTFGTNNPADPGDLTPKIACKNAIPAGMAYHSINMDGVAIPNDGTAYAGAKQA